MFLLSIFESKMADSVDEGDCRLFSSCLVISMKTRVVEGVHKDLNLLFSNYKLLSMSFPLHL
jgi:hypothetical protein